MSGFSWIIEGVLAGMPYPGRFGSLEAELRDLHAAGIATVVTLTERPLERDAVERAGVRAVHIPIYDFTPPTIEQVLDCVELFKQHKADTAQALADAATRDADVDADVDTDVDPDVDADVMPPRPTGMVIHCAAGIGRTGTMLACCLVSEGITANDAIDRIRLMRPGSIETLEQEDRIREFQHVWARLNQA